jgi:hypothetical protein
MNIEDDRDRIGLYFKIYQTYYWQGHLLYVEQDTFVFSAFIFRTTKIITPISGGLYLKFETYDHDFNYGFRVSFQRFNPMSGPLIHLYSCPDIRINATATPQLLPAIPNQLEKGTSCMFQIYSDAFVKFNAETVSPSINVNIDGYYYEDVEL